MLKPILVCATAAVLVAACAYDYDRPGPRYAGDYRYDGCSDNAALGTVLGAVAGGVIGSQFGSGSGKTAATVGGAVLGGIAGNAIARDACRDRRYDAYYYNEAYYDAFDEPDYGRRYEWRNPHTRHYGYVTPVRYYEGGRFGYRECREFRHTVYAYGDDYEETSIACRRPDGTWQIVEE